jgi:hypothetical protein
VVAAGHSASAVSAVPAADTQPYQHVPSLQYPPGDPFGAPAAGYGPAPEYGQPTQFPQQSAHHALFTAPAEKRSKRNLALIAGVAGALAAVIIVVLVLGFWAPGFLKATNLDVDAAQSGVKQILMDGANGYGVKDVTDVKATTGGTRKCRKARRSTARSAWTAPNAK